MGDYSTKNITQRLIEETYKSLENLDLGSVELYIQNGEVV